MSSLAILTTIFGTAMALGYFPQAYKIYKAKSAKNISILTFAIFSLGSLFWLLHGIAIDDVPLVISSIPGTIGSWLVLFLSIKYRK